MNRASGKITAFILILAFVVTGIPLNIISQAAAENINLTVTYNTSKNKYDISCPVSEEPGRIELSFHNPDGDLISITYTEFNYSNFTATVSTELLPDHIYDITLDVFRNVTDTEPAYSGKVYYLADITFTGESFNVMAKMADIEDLSPVLDPNEPGKAVLVKSGENPKIRLRWKIPTIYVGGGTKSLTDPDALSLLSEPDVPIAKANFQIDMTVGHGSTKHLVFNTDYDKDGNMIVVGKDSESHVTVTGPDSNGFVSVTLDKNQEIEPGTEYEFTNIGIIFENASSEQITLRRTKLQTDSGNRFLVKNIDNAFRDAGPNLSSIFTPMWMQLSKVDTDKVEVKFKKITNGVYPELYYQVQYAPRIDDLYTESQKWVKIPASALPENESVGTEIVTINLTDTTHPEYYFRVVFYDSSSPLPRSSSLCINLQYLGVETGKPPLPKEIKAEAVYVGKKKVTVPTTDISQGEVEIALSDLRLSFEKPLAWQNISDWEFFKSQSYTDDDYVFHIILSTYLPDANSNEARTKNIGLTEDVSVYLPLKQKRVLVVGKKNLKEENGRLVVDITGEGTIPGDNLFYDYVYNNGLGRKLTNENNEDPSEDGIPGDYPAFLVPNTTYYMQVFTSRYKDLAQIDQEIWGDSDGLSEGLKSKISFLSPVISFTTYPVSEQPVPMPDTKLDIEPETYVNPVTGDMSLEGISVSFEQILTEGEWQRYTTAEEGRQIEYRIFISRNPSTGFELAENKVVTYPNQEAIHKVVIKKITDQNGNEEPILPNTVYYIKAYATLVVDGVELGRSNETAVKAITTPKIDTGGLENADREPRAPSEFSIAKDSEGNDIVSDAFVTLNWLHAEEDVTYEMICTSVGISSRAKPEEYESDPFNISFLNAYSEFRDPANDVELHLDVNDQELKDLGFVLEENGRAILPIDRDFLRPNRIYFFSLRAVRNRGLTNSEGESIETVSRWVTVPVTTTMVKAPAFLEAVRDLEIGFNIECTASGVTADDMEVYIKKSGVSGAEYVKLNRAQFTCVRDGSTFYIRIFNLENDQWYDVRVKNTMNNTWYDNTTGSWSATAGSPVQRKTRNNLNEIEVRWEGRDPYEYFLEIRTEYESEYRTLNYSSSGQTDLGYDLPNGSRIKFYREKSNLYVQEGMPEYIYYAKITNLRSNMNYYVKVWAFNMDESIHVGPVTARTDFSQQDYDEGKKEDDITDLFENSADSFLKKLYWLVDIKNDTNVRAIIKDDKVSALLRMAKGSTVTVDLSSEKSDGTYFEILIPYKSLEAVETYDSRLNIKVPGAEITLNRGSIDLEKLKSEVGSNNKYEAMLLVKISKKTRSGSKFPSGMENISGIYEVNIQGIGSLRTYSQISNTIFEILNKPDATGPFNYGILDRELSAILKDLGKYSFRSHTDLRDMINRIIRNVEVELSRYLKDVIDGGRGNSPNYVISRDVTEFPGRIGVKLEYSYRNGYIAPYVNYGAGWNEASGAKGYVAQYVLFRVEKPGEYVVLVSAGPAIIQPDPSAGGSISKIQRVYDLSKVFGTGTIYPDNPVNGEQAIMLFAVLTRREGEIIGQTPAKKASILGIGNIVTSKQLNGYMDNQSSVSMAVELYCIKSGINSALMNPTRIIHIANINDVRPQLYKHVMLGVDLELVELSQNLTFDAEGRTSIGMLLDMMSRVLEKLGEL